MAANKLEGNKRIKFICVGDERGGGGEGNMKVGDFMFHHKFSHSCAVSLCVVQQ